MRLLCSLIFVIIALTFGAEAQNTTVEEALSLIQAMPSCGSTCLLSGIANSTCKSDDIPCSCNNKALSAAVTACVAETCTIKEELTMKNKTETLCQRPARDKRRSSQRSVIVGLVLSSIAFVVRIISKINFPFGNIKRWSHSLWWDDAVLTFTVACAIGTSCSAFPLNANGLGVDIWVVPFDHITELLRIYFYAEILYTLALPGVKISLLLSYLRFFPSMRFRQACFVFMGLNVAYAVTFLFADIFQCIPVHMAWDRWVYKSAADMPGHCNNINAQGWASSATNMVLDICTLSLPLPALWKLQLNKRKKFWVMLMFTVGFFVSIVSIIRLGVLVRFGNSSNLTWDYTSPGYWSTVELDTSIVCACMPSIRNLLRKFMPYLMGNSIAGSGGSGAPKANSSGISNRTARSDGLSVGKRDRDITIRTMDSDEETFIPMEDTATSSHNKTAPLPPV